MVGNTNPMWILLLLQVLSVWKKKMVSLANIELLMLTLLLEIEIPLSRFVCFSWIKVGRQISGSLRNIFWDNH